MTARTNGPALLRTRPLLVTGGAGFVGCNLASRLASEGEDVLVWDTLSRPGVRENISWLKRQHPQRISAVIADVRDDAAADAVCDASGVFHMAGQVAVTTSLRQPVEDLDINVRGTLNLLEAARRRSNPIPFIFASTNKVYGDLAEIAIEDGDEACRPADLAVYRHGIGEGQPLCFHTPYGCSKGAAEQYVLDYARTFGLPNVVLRMSCIYGPHQYGSEDQGWVAHFLVSALARTPITIYGDGHQVRDLLFVDDAVDAYVEALRQIGRVKGRPFNLGGGPANAVSLLQVLKRIEEILARPIELSFSASRPGDQRFYVSDRRRIDEALGLSEPLPWRRGLALLAAWVAGRTGSKIVCCGADTQEEVSL